MTANVIMIILTIFQSGNAGSMTQTATETTLETCQLAQQQLSGGFTIKINNWNTSVSRKVDCIPIK
ncbi:MAG: hypothetical protein WA058_01595 [Minisyncoccia bacterium]